MPDLKPLPHLKALREQRKLTQLALALKAGVGQMTIIRIEQGTPAKEATIQRLATALEVDAQALTEGGQNGKH